MQYLLTGATGFIGRHLMERLIERGGTVHALVRARSRARLTALARAAGAADGQVRPIIGDIGEPNLGLDAEVLESLTGQIDHLFHLAAVYDMNVDDITAQRINVHGTQHTVDVARAIGVKSCFHLASSIAVAGRFNGNFLEAMFDEDQPLDHPYFRTKFESERIVRQMTDLPFRIYRPGVVVGHSQTGEMDKIDGPYYFFKLIQRLRDLLPPWVPLVGVEGGAIPLVPVDFVSAAMDYLAHAPGHDGKAFHLSDPNARSVGDTINTICRAAHAPEFAMRVDLRHFRRLVPSAVFSTITMIPAVRSLWNGMFEDLGIPPSAVNYIDSPTTYDTREMEAALQESGIACPPLASYAPRIWDYWEREMDPALHQRRNLEECLQDKIVVVTGASSGIGRDVALRIGAHGGRVLALARTRETLEALAAEIEAGGGACQVYPVDLSDMDACDRVVADILKDHGHVDILINNAGRSIRRSVALSYDRFHDYQRLMQVNYFGALKLIMGFLPSMCERKQGHIINVSSIGVQAGAARFSAYISSKAALDTFSRALACEIHGDNVHVTTVYMPLVKTPMIAPTRLYENMPTMDVGLAAEMVITPILTRPKTVTTRLGTFAEVLNALVPKMADRIQNLVFRIVPESAAAKGRAPETEQEVSVEAVVLANLLRGMHL